MGRKTEEVGGDANLLLLNFYALLALSSKLSVFLKLCIMNTLVHFLRSQSYRSLKNVSLRGPHALLRLDQKVLSRLAECDDVIWGSFFQPCLGHPNPKSITDYNKLLPNHFDDYFIPINSIHSHSTRLSTSNNLFLPWVNSSSGKCSLTFVDPKVWSSIPDDIKPLTTLA